MDFINSVFAWAQQHPWIAVPVFTATANAGFWVIRKLNSPEFAIAHPRVAAVFRILAGIGIDPETIWSGFVDLVQGRIRVHSTTIEPMIKPEVVRFKPPTIPPGAAAMLCMSLAGACFITAVTGCPAFVNTVATIDSYVSRVLQFLGPVIAAFPVLQKQVNVILDLERAMDDIALAVKDGTATTADLVKASAAVWDAVDALIAAASDELAKAKASGMMRAGPVDLDAQVAEARREAHAGRMAAGKAVR